MSDVWEERLLAGTFDLWLCNDPDSPHAWLVVSVGLWTELQLFDEEPAARIGHFDFTPHPLLFLPRPPAPAAFTARCARRPSSNTRCRAAKLSQEAAHSTPPACAGSSPDVKRSAPNRRERGGRGTGHRKPPCVC